MGHGGAALTNPVPGYSVTTPYREQSSGLWGACGWHTGQDYAAPQGAMVVAARGGQVFWVNYGSGLGNHQFCIRPGDGTEDFYAHCVSRPANGMTVVTGEYVAGVGSEGNATGPHLHFERHTSYGWSCDSMDDPAISAAYLDVEEPEAPKVRTHDMFTVRGEDSSEIYLIGSIRNTHLGDPNDVTELQHAIADPYYTAVVSSYTLQQILVESE